MEEGQKVTFKMVCISQFNPVWKFLSFSDIHKLNYAQYISITWLHVYINILYLLTIMGQWGLYMRENVSILGPDFLCPCRVFLRLCHNSPHWFCRHLLYHLLCKWYIRDCVLILVIIIVLTSTIMGRNSQIECISVFQVTCIQRFFIKAVIYHF